MLDRHRLGDHPAHRRADQVCAVEAERAHQPDGVAGHVGQRVGRRGGIAAEDRAEIGRRRIGEVAREPDVPVVEADDVHAPPNQGVAEPIRPPEHLRGQAYQQQHGWQLGVPEPLVRDVQTTRPHPAGDLDGQRRLPITQNLSRFSNR